MSFPWLWSRHSERAVRQEAFFVTDLVELLDVRSTLNDFFFFAINNWECSIIHHKDSPVLTLHCLPEVVQVFYLKHKLIIKVHPVEWGLHGSELQKVKKSGEKKNFHV